MARSPSAGHRGCPPAPPRRATPSHGAIGRSTMTSRPSSRNRGCGAIRTTRYRSPAAPCAAAAAALAGQPDALTVDDTGRDVDVVRAHAARPAQADRAAPAPVGLFDGQRQLGLAVGAGRVRPRWSPTAARATAEEIAEQIADVDASGLDGPLAILVRRPATARPRGALVSPPGSCGSPGRSGRSGARVSGSESTWYASLISLNRSSASGALLMSGWCRRASVRNARCSSSASASRLTPSTS